MKRNEIKKLAQEKIKKTMAIHVVDATLPSVNQVFKYEHF